MSSGSGAQVQVEVDLYSGRPNPTWTLPPEAVALLEQRLATAPRATNARMSDPGLGYRGLTVALPISTGGVASIRIFAGLVERVTASGAVLVRDDQRALERALIATASDKIPYEVFEYINRIVGPA